MLEIFLLCFATSLPKCWTLTHQGQYWKHGFSVCTDKNINWWSEGASGDCHHPDSCQAGLGCLGSAVKTDPEAWTWSFLRHRSAAWLCTSAVWSWEASASLCTRTSSSVKWGLPAGSQSWRKSLMRCCMKSSAQNLSQGKKKSESILGIWLLTSFKIYPYLFPPSTPLLGKTEWSLMRGNSWEFVGILKFSPSLTPKTSSQSPFLALSGHFWTSLGSLLYLP